MEVVDVLVKAGADVNQALTKVCEHYQLQRPCLVRWTLKWVHMKLVLQILLIAKLFVWQESVMLYWVPWLAVSYTQTSQHGPLWHDYKHRLLVQNNIAQLHANQLVLFQYKIVYRWEKATIMVCEEVLCSQLFCFNYMALSHESFIIISTLVLKVDVATF